MQDKRRKMTTDDRQLVTRSELVVVHGLEAPIALPNGGEVVELAVLPDGRRDRLLGKLRAVRLAVLTNGTVDVVALPVAQVRELDVADVGAGSGSGARVGNGKMDAPGVPPR